MSWRRSKPLFVGLTAFAILLLPAMGPVRFMSSCVADRFLYFPLVFLLLPLAVLIRRLEILSPARPHLIHAAAGVFALPMLVLMYGQQQVWRDSKTLWSHVADRVPNFAKAHGNLAFLYLEEGHYESALASARRTLEIEPDQGVALHLMGRALTRLGRPREAVEPISRALKIGMGPNEASAWSALSEAHASIGDMNAAKADCERAIALGADAAAAYIVAGDAALRFGKRYDAAVECYRESLQRDPLNTVVRWNLGTALAALGKSREALTEYEQVIAIYREKKLDSLQLEPVAAKLRERLTGATTRPAGK
jgi:tetratricopeptide (TPR) repeat protein